MTTTAFVVAGQAVTWAGVIALAATLQLLALAMWSGFSKSKFAKTGLRKCDVALLAGGAIFLAAYAVAFDARTLVREATATPADVSQASMTGSGESRRSCASLRNGMRISEVKQKVGSPDQVIKEEDVRGPGAEVWIYTDRCAAHVFEGKLEFVE